MLNTNTTRNNGDCGVNDGLTDTAAVSCQRNANTGYTTDNNYGGTGTQGLYKPGKNVSDRDERSSADDVVVPARARTANHPPATSADGEGECIVADDATTVQPNTFTGKLRHFLLNNDPLLYASLKWGLAALLLFFLLFIVFGMLYSGLHYNTNCTASGNSTISEGMPGWCHTRFGTILGSFENTYSYSNCNDDYVSIQDSYMTLTVPVRDAETGGLTTSSELFYTGLAWQCVEYARRYWMINGRPKPAYFGSVDGAADIWNLTEVHLLENTSQTLPLQRYRSGDRIVQDGLQPPQRGDIIIYPIQPGGFPVGHVAVITKVEMAEHGTIYVAEQNWGSMQWPGPYHNFSRKIPLRYDAATTAITLDDPAGRIIGWMRYG